MPAACARESPLSHASKAIPGIVLLSWRMPLSAIYPIAGKSKPPLHKSTDMTHVPCRRQNHRKQMIYRAFLRTTIIITTSTDVNFCLESATESLG